MSSAVILVTWATGQFELELIFVDALVDSVIGAARNATGVDARSLDDWLGDRRSAVLVPADQAVLVTMVWTSTCSGRTVKGAGERAVHSRVLRVGVVARN